MRQNLDAAALLEKHRGKGVLLDANLLVLLVVGSYDRSLIGKHRRTSQFTAEDFDLLEELLGLFTQMKVTPNALTEASNLICTSAGRLRASLHERLKILVDSGRESYHASKRAMADSIYAPLGLSDAVLSMTASSQSLLITVDLDLYTMSSRRGRPCVNFNHLRRMNW